MDRIDAYLAKVQDALTEIESKRKFTQEQRDKDASTGAALPDGSYPIENESDLKNAISAYGRAKDKAAAKAHIMARAAALGCEDMLPDGWGDKSDGIDPETKVRHIRTPEGERRFGGKIGDPIADDMLPSTDAATVRARGRASNTPRNYWTGKPRTGASGGMSDAGVSRAKRGVRIPRPSAKKPAMPLISDKERAEMARVEALPRKTQMDRSMYMLERAVLDSRSDEFAVARGLDGWPRIQRQFGNGFTFILTLHDNGATYDTNVYKANGDRIVQGVIRGDAASIRQYGLDSLFDKMKKQTEGTDRISRELGAAIFGGMKWDDADLELKVAVSTLESAGTHQWVEDPEYNGVIGFVEKDSMKAAVVVYPDGAYDVDMEFKNRFVRDPEYWGMPYGTPIHPGMKPVNGATGPKA